MLGSYSSSQRQSWLSWFLKGVLVLGALVLLGRLAELQVIKGGYYRSLAEDNRIRRIPIVAPRGKILARGGELLVGNNEVQKTVIFDPDGGLTKVPIEADTKKDEIITEWTRNYRYGADFGHITGYLGEVTQDEVGKVDPDCSDRGPEALGSLVGRSGIEEEYECSLRGVDGQELVEVDTVGRKLRTLGRKPPVPGTDITTTIDFGLQQKVAEVMRGLKGALVATDGHGQVIAMYSTPSYDPRYFVGTDEKDSNEVQKYLSDSALPLFNRAIGGVYHPGSIFKIVTAAAALEDGKIDDDFTYDDTGFIKVNDFLYTNWYYTQYGGVEGNINLQKAIARSTDTFFYKIGELVGVDRLSYWANQFGLGEKTNIDLPGEVAGLIPTPAWKRAVLGERWFLGNTYHMAIGQGDVTTSPIEANLVTSVIASNGTLCDAKVNINKPDVCKKLPISEHTISDIKEGMLEACQTGGTAFPFFDFQPQVACKTGTAETGEKDKTHAWFTVFAPASAEATAGKPAADQQIVLTVLIEKGGEGSQVAAPLAHEVLDYYFHQR